MAFTMNGRITDLLPCFLQNFPCNFSRAVAPDTTLRSDNIFALLREHLRPNTSKLCTAFLNYFPSSSYPIFTMIELFRNLLVTDKRVSYSCNHSVVCLMVCNTTNSVHKWLFFGFMKNSSHFDFVKFRYYRLSAI